MHRSQVKYSLQGGSPALHALIPGLDTHCGYWGGGWRLASERWLRAFMGRERRVEKKEGMEGGREGIKIGVQLLFPGLRTLECSRPHSKKGHSGLCGV